MEEGEEKEVVLVEVLVDCSLCLLASLRDFRGGVALSCWSATCDPEATYLQVTHLSNPQMQPDARRGARWTKKDMPVQINPGTLHGTGVRIYYSPIGLQSYRT